MFTFFLVYLQAGSSAFAKDREVEVLNRKITPELGYLIDDIFENLIMGFTRNGDDFLGDHLDGDFAHCEQLWFIYARWRLEMGRPCPWVSISNSMASACRPDQIEALNNCSWNKGIKAHQMRRDFGRFVAWRCPSCGDGEGKPHTCDTEQFIAKNDLTCSRCLGGRLKENGAKL